MRLLYVSLFLFSMQTALAEAPSSGSLWLFRWNLGYRAENSPVAKANITEAEFQKVLTAGYIPAGIKDKIYPGCYLVNFRRPADRSLASTTPRLPISEVHRLCVPPSKE